MEKSLGDAFRGPAAQRIHQLFRVWGSMANSAKRYRLGTAYALATIVLLSAHTPLSLTAAQRLAAEHRCAFTRLLPRPAARSRFHAEPISRRPFRET
jgi:hypothetical protein